MVFARSWVWLLVVAVAVLFGFVSRGHADFPPSGPKQTYKGFTLIGSTYPNAKNERFFKMAKQAIDMTAALPQEDRQRIATIKTIQFDPPSKHRKVNDYRQNIVGVYTYSQNIGEPGVMIIYKKLLYSSPMQIALSLQGNAFHASRHRLLRILTERIGRLEASGAAGSGSQIEQAKKLRASLVALREKKNPDLQARSECVIDKSLLKARKIFGADTAQLNLYSAELTKRNCWKKTVGIEEQTIQFIRQVDGKT